MASGLSSGEGLLAAFSDHDDGTPADRRLVVTEAEFARVLSVGKRDGNTLPAILRDLWDGGHARTLTKGSPLRVDNVHLVVVGHISPRELCLKLSEADVSGGTLNRFLPVLVERTKLLPESPTPPNLDKLVREVGASHRIAGRAPARAYARTPAGRRYWAEVYRALDEVDTGGALSEIVARAPAYVQRIALLYAIADKETEIDVCHLRAALALVKYSIDSCRIVFGDTGGTGDLGKLSTALQKAQHQQLTMTQVSAVFSRNKPAATLEPSSMSWSMAVMPSTSMFNPAKGHRCSRSTGSESPHLSTPWRLCSKPERTADLSHGQVFRPEMLRRMPRYPFKQSPHRARKG